MVKLKCRHLDDRRDLLVVLVQEISPIVEMTTAILIYKFRIWKTTPILFLPGIPQSEPHWLQHLYAGYLPRSTCSGYLVKIHPF